MKGLIDIDKHRKSLFIVPAIVLVCFVSPALADVSGWTWQNPYPQGNDLKAIWGSGSNDIFAAGVGTLVHYDGSTWSVMDSGSDSWDIVFAIWGSGPNDVFAGSQEKIFHYDGAKWTTTLKGVAYGTIYAIWGTGPNNVYAGGTAGKILHYDGTGWSFIAGETPPTIRGIWGSGPDDIFAVGYGGTILHYDGSGWSAMASGTVHPLYAVWGSGPNDVYAVGDTSDRLWTEDPIMLHYDGKTWSPMANPATRSLLAVWGSGPQDVYALSSYRLFHYDGSNWSSVANLIGPLDGGSTYPHGFTSIWGTGPNNVYVVETSGLIERYDGSNWSAITTWVTTSALNDVWGSDSNDVFAVGANGTIVRYDGSNWSTVPSGTDQSLSAVWGSGPDDAFAVGERGTILHYNGTAWSQMTQTISYATVMDVWGSGPEDVFALIAGYWPTPWVYKDAAILHYDGTAWSAMTVPSIWSFGTIWGSGPNDVYVIANDGILHYDGSSWSAVDLGTSPPRLLDIWGTGPQNVFASGMGAILHYDGSTWSPMPVGKDWTYLQVWGINPTDVYAVGQKVASGLLHYDGVQWLVEEPASLAMSVGHIGGSSSNGLFSVGGRGTIFHRALQQGKISIDTSPIKQNVFVDGLLWGPSPQNWPIAIGQHTISFSEARGYATPASQVVNIDKNQTVTVLGEYLRVGTLSIDTVPIKQEIFVDNISWGLAPQSQVIAAGQHVVHFADADGYITPADQVVTVEWERILALVGQYVPTLATPAPEATLSSGASLGVGPLSSPVGCNMPGIALITVLFFGGFWIVGTRARDWLPRDATNESANPGRQERDKL